MPRIATPKTTAKRKVQKKLYELVVSLERHNFIWPARCFHAYLSGKTTSLDEAFGLAPKGTRGRRLESRNNELARKVFVMRLGKGCFGKDPMSWEDIAENLGIVDVRALKRMYDRRKIELMAEHLKTKRQQASARLKRMRQRRVRIVTDRK